MICEPPNELQNMPLIELYLLEMFLDYEASQVKDYDFTENVLQWSKHNMKFLGKGE